MGNIVFNTFKMRQLGGATGAIDLLNDTIKVMLFETDSDDDPDHEFIGDLTGGGGGTEATMSGYTGGFGGAGRKTLASKTFTVDQTNNRFEFDCADITWSALGSGTIASLAAAKEVTNDAASPVCWKIDTATGLPLPTNGSDVTVTVDAEGMYQIA